MKKVLLIGFVIFCIFQLMVMAAVITMGNTAEDRTNTLNYNNTLVDQLNPADGTGTITQVEIYTYTAMTNAQVAIFSASGNNLTSHASVTIGNVAIGYTSHEVSLAVSTGNYIGIYYQTGKCDTDYVSGAGGMWYLAGDQIPCTGATFTFSDYHTMSLKGTGATPPAGITWNTKIISKWNNVTISKWNGM